MKAHIPKQKFQDDLKGHNGSCQLGQDNDVGSLKVCRTTVNANRLTAGNFSACPTIDVIKQAAHYRKQFLIDEDIFKEMRVLMHFFREADTNSS
ncbi:unnamed protein product [Didymodactylos carnosus]|uniref:Uncharacterized protein n=1 Tax=Didymodactylos carnosus TaxID=1234261 RepID=A0A814H9V1_9BILA|nr:unnamed protein product [Didymodactylos carnosus]CAF3778150.1 unnamed protein product [Didymodactylos carnosus]